MRKRSSGFVLLRDSTVELLLNRPSCRQASYLFVIGRIILMTFTGCFQCCERSKTVGRLGMGSKTSFQQAQRQTASGKRLKRMFIFHTVRKSFILNGSSLHQFEHRVSTCVICVCDLWDIPVHINHINCTRLATWGYTKSVAQVKYACQILLNRTYSCPHYLKRHMIWISMPNIRNHDVASSCDRNKMY